MGNDDTIEIAKLRYNHYEVKRKRFTKKLIDFMVERVVNKKIKPATEEE